MRRATDDILAVMDLQTNEKKIIQRTRSQSRLGKKLFLHMSTVYWKSDERLLFRVTIRPDESLVLTLMSSKIYKLGDRLFAINRDGSKLTPLLADNRNSALEGAFDLGAIMSFLPKDPQHILMVLDGFNGRSLFKVDLETGLGEQMERPNENVVGWWLDVDGNPVVRIMASDGSIRLFRKDAGRQVAQVLHHAHTRDERAAGVRSRGSVRPARQVLRAGAAARQGSHRPLSIRHRERRVRRAG